MGGLSKKFFRVTTCFHPNYANYSVCHLKSHLFQLFELLYFTFSARVQAIKVKAELYMRQDLGIFVNSLHSII